MPNSGALMISGDWGCGKTHHIDNVVFPELKKQNYIPVRVSLFGLSSIDDLPSRIFDKYLDNFNREKDGRFWKKIKSKAGKMTMKFGEKLSSLKMISDYVDMEKLLGNNREFYYRFVPADKTIIVFDDLERVTKTVDLHILLGAINDLIEQRKYKIVVVSNNSYLNEIEKDNLVFKEKVVEKTIEYKPDIVSLYKELINKGKYIDEFKSFMTNPDCTSIIDPNNSLYKSDMVKRDLSNIRILKFAVTHFYKVFDCLWKNQKDKSDDDFLIFLKALWSCTVGLSIEYKKNRLTNQDKREYSEFVEIPMFSLNLGVDDSVTELFETEEEKKIKQKKMSSSEIIRNMYKTYVKCHGLPIVISIELFELITAGYFLNETKLFETWRLFQEDAQRNKKSPAYLLLDKFIQSVWTFSNEEMPCQLNILASYVEKGDYYDNVSYINAATYLLHYQSLTKYSVDEITIIVKKGIDIMYSRMKDFQISMKKNLDIIEYEIPGISKWVLQYEKDKIKELDEKKKSKDINEVSNQFKKDITILAKRLTPNYEDTNALGFIDTPILSYIPKDIVIEKMNSITPSEVMSLSTIIDFRFNQSDNYQCISQEFPFIENVKEGLLERDYCHKVFSDYLIEDHLKKIIERTESLYNSEFCPESHI